MHSTSSERHAALKRANKSFSKNTLKKKLNAIAVLQRNTNPEISQIAKRDMEWLDNNIND